MKKPIILFLLFTCLQLAAMPGIAKSALRLTPAETAFIKSHPVIRASNELEWMPFNFNEDGVPMGYSIDYMNLLAERTGLAVRYVSGPSWNGFLNQLKNRKLDVALNIAQTPDREKYALFTAPYLTNPNTIVSLKDKPYQNLDQLNGKTVAVIKGFFYAEFLASAHPEIKMIMVDGISEALNAVAFGQADATIGELAVFSYALEKNMYNNLMLSGGVNLDNSALANLRMAVRSDWPVLRDILQKAMDSVTWEETRRLKRKWIMAGEKQPGYSVCLSPEERRFLDQKGVVRVCVDPNWMPYEQIDKKGNHVGMSSNFVKTFQERLGVPLELVPTKSWAESLACVQNRTADILPMACVTPARKQFLDFTTPFISFPYVIVTTNDKRFVSDLGEVADKTFCLVKGYSAVEELRAKYPGIKIIEVENIAQGIEKVRDREVFGYIDAVAPIGHQIQKGSLQDVKISGVLKNHNFDLSVATRNDEPLLGSCFQKVVNSLTAQDIKIVYDKWIPVTMESEPDHTLVWRVLAVAGIILLGFAYWTRRLAKERNKTQKALKDLHLLRKKLEEKNLELGHQAITDRLTKLYNRTRLDEALEMEIRRSERSGRTFGLILLDVDLFKSVNDTYGHHVGDMVLTTMADLLRSSTRMTDIVGRWGGEEFLIICPDVGEQGVATLAEKLRKIIENTEFPVVKTKTASFGVTVYRSGDSAQPLIHRVDKALYQAKNQGRNRVISA